MLHHTNQRAFTLVELSIVLVIIGLIIAGVLVGRDLIRQSELRSVITEVEKYQSAVYTFRGKYGQLPGDMTNATTFWASTANGNGNKVIDYYATLGTANLEAYKAWQQLALAGLVEGTYTGTASLSGVDYVSVIGSNVPASKVRGGGYSFYDTDATASTSNWGNTSTVGSLLSFGTAGAAYTNGVILTATDAYSIDKKMDDGTYTTGKVLGGDGGCRSGSTYNTTTTAVNCMLYFVMY